MAADDIIAGSGPSRAPDDMETPTDDQHNAVCVEVVDLGMQPTTYEGKDTGLKHKIRIWWQLEERDSKGNRFLVGRRYTLSSHPNAALRQMCESWRGKKYPDEYPAINVSKFIGVPALVSTAVNERGYADVQSVVKLPKQIEAIEIEEFELPGKGDPQPVDTANVPDPDDDSDLHF